VVIACARTREDLLLLEVDLISQYGTFWAGGGGYNMTRGGEGGMGVTLNGEQRKARSARNKRLWTDPSYRERIRAVHLGAKRPKETGEKISLAAKTRKRTPEAIAKLAEAGVKGRMIIATNPEIQQKRLASMVASSAVQAAWALVREARSNLVYTDEMRERAAAAQRGKVLTPEHRKNVGAGLKASEKHKASIKNRGPASDGARRNMSLASKGKPKSAETRARMVAAWDRKKAERRASVGPDLLDVV